MSSPRTSVGMLRRVLGTELARLRSEAGLKQEDAAAHLGKAANKISRVETGRIGISKVHLDVLMALYEATEGDRTWCHELQGKTAVRRGRPRAETTLFLGPKWFRAFRDLEWGATEVMEVGSEFVTGILQTEPYTRAMSLAQGVNSDDKTVGDTVRVRAERKELLVRGGARYSFVLNESCLRRRIGSRSVMAEQMRHLAEVGDMPNVTIQVIPFDSLSYQHVATNFTLFRFGRDLGDDIVYIELLDGAAYMDKLDLVRAYPASFARLRGVALGPVESRNLILELGNQFASDS